MSEQLSELGLLQLRDLYLRREVSVARVMQHLFERIEANRGTTNAWISLTEPFQLMQRAGAWDACLHRHADALERFPLLGVPFSVKDNIDVAGLPTTAACPAFAYEASVSAALVQRLEGAGAVCLGKNNMDQFASGLSGTRSPYGVCPNAYQAEYISGGSSSGSAVAVARGEVSFSLGTDTAGSGRVPAALNNVFGYKPTPGRWSTAGVVPACRSLDCVSVFAQSAGDARLVAEVLEAGETRGRTPTDRWMPSPTLVRPLDDTPPIRLGVPHELEFFGDETAQALYETAVSRCVAAGCQIVSVDLSPCWQVGELLYQGPFVVERDVAFGQFVSEHPEACTPIVRDIIASARKYSARDVVLGIQRVQELETETRELWNEVDALVLPTTPTVYTVQQMLADPVGLNDRLGVYTRFANLLRLTAMAMPAGFLSSGVPYGVSLLAPAHHDLWLNDLSCRLERASVAPSMHEQ